MVNRSAEAEVSNPSADDSKKEHHPNGWCSFLAEDEGFEPPQTESESGVLPLHKSSIWNGYIICNYLKKSSPDFEKS